MLYIRGFIHKKMYYTKFDVCLITFVYMAGSLQFNAYIIADFIFVMAIARQYFTILP